MTTRIRRSSQTRASDILRKALARLEAKRAKAQAVTDLCLAEEDAMRQSLAALNPVPMPGMDKLPIVPFDHIVATGGMPVVEGIIPLPGVIDPTPENLAAVGIHRIGEMVTGCPHPQTGIVKGKWVCFSCNATLKQGSA